MVSVGVPGVSELSLEGTGIVTRVTSVGIAGTLLVVPPVGSIETMTLVI